MHMSFWVRLARSTKGFSLGKPRVGPEVFETEGVQGFGNVPANSETFRALLLWGQREQMWGRRLSYAGGTATSSPTRGAPATPTRSDAPYPQRAHRQSRRRATPTRSRLSPAPPLLKRLRGFPTADPGPRRR